VFLKTKKHLSLFFRWCHRQFMVAIDEQGFGGCENIKNYHDPADNILRSSNR